MLNGVDYSAPTAGGSGGQPSVVFKGALTGGSTNIDMSSYSEYFYDGPYYNTSTYVGNDLYSGTVRGRYIIIRIVGSIDNKMFSDEICIGVPANKLDVLYHCSTTGELPTSTICMSCVSKFYSAKSLYPPDTYGNIRTDRGHFQFELVFTGDSYAETRLKISIVDVNNLRLHRVELL